MISPKIISSLFGQANESGEKSTIVHTVIWLIGLVIVGLIMLVVYDAPVWICVCFVVMMFSSFIFYVMVFWHCLKNNPDLLRSEKMVIQKLALEKTVMGDSVSGEIEISRVTPGMSNLIVSPSDTSTSSQEDK